jgi:hypothetical protein
MRRERRKPTRLEQLKSEAKPSLFLSDRSNKRSPTSEGGQLTNMYTISERSA